ncbi:hypothetical protein [Geodermatophilus sp. SYSU D00815]
MRVHASIATGAAGPRVPGLPQSAVTGGELLAPATSLHGLDVLRRSQDRAPPGVR